MVNVEFRAATRDDAEHVVSLIYAAAPALYDFVYGSRGRAYIRHEFLGGWGRVGWRRCRVAEENGEVVAVIACLDWFSYHTSELAGVLRILCFYGLRKGWSVLKRGLGMRRLIPPVRFRSFFPQNLGVHPAHRNRGIGERLLRRVVDDARAEGYKWLSFDVMADNRAWRLYQRMGFSNIDKECKIEGVGLSSSYRVCVPL